MFLVKQLPHVVGLRNVGRGDRCIPIGDISLNSRSIVRRKSEAVELMIGFHLFNVCGICILRMCVPILDWSHSNHQQAINRNEALYTYTRWSSEFVLREDTMGSIEPKKVADFVVLNRDYLTVPEEEIGRLDPVLTVVGGKLIYTDPDFATSQGLPQVGFRGSRERWQRGGPEDRNRQGGGGGA